MKSFKSSVPVFALVLWTPALCSAASYSVTDLGTLGGTNSQGFGINASGQVTGVAFTTGDAAFHAFLYDGTMHDLGTLGGNISSGGGINASGQVTGYSNTTGNVQHAFLYDGTMHDLGTLGGTNSIGQGINASGNVTGYSAITGDLVVRAFLYDGTMHDLGTLGGTNSQGYGINASGQVTGNSDTTGNATHAFLYDGTMHDLGTLGGTNSQGYGINASGQVTGNSDTTGNVAQHAFLYDGTMHDLGTLGGRYSFGYGINASGQVTGYSYTTGDAAYHAFLYDAAHGMVDLNSLINPSSGWVLLHGSAINDVGQITGDGTINGQQHAFLLTPVPVPEPSSLLLGSLALGALAAYRGWLSFNGECGKGSWGRMGLKEILPVRCLDVEDLRESTEGYRAQVVAVDHPVFEGLDLDEMPLIVGYNIVEPREGCQVLACWQGEDDPMLASGRFGKGRVLAYTSDPAPHWGCHFVYWNGYNRF